MNSSSRLSVQATVWMMMINVSCVGLIGCVEIDGGALEAGWVINTAEKGIRIDCACAQLVRVRFTLQPVDGGEVDPCRDDACLFACEREVGTTRFMIPEGSYSISLVPLDEAGDTVSATEGVVAVPPVVRQVRSGELTNLGVNLFLVERRRLAGPSACEPEWLEE